jgi:nucleotide-binding universal stress UspA family protein
MYKTIVLHVDDGSQFSTRLRVAVDLAERHGAHLIGSAVTGIAAHDYAMVAASPFGPLPLVDMQEVRERTADTLARFQDEARRLGAASVETRLIEDNAERALVLQSAYADLIVVGQNEAGTTFGAPVATGVADYVALHGTRPVLVVPAGCRNTAVGSRIVVGWNASTEASRAVLAALPLLRNAQLVRVAVIAPQLLALRHGEEPGADLATYLARHGVRVEVAVDDAETEAGAALLRQAEHVGADLIVAGAYGRSRYREWIAGGATRSLLDNQQVPVLLAH